MELLREFLSSIGALLAELPGTWSEYIWDQFQAGVIAVISFTEWLPPEVTGVIAGMIVFTLGLKVFNTVLGVFT